MLDNKVNKANGDFVRETYHSLSMRELGELLRAARKAKGIDSMQKLGEMLGVSRSAVNQWELGQTVPEMERIPDLARILELDPQVIYAMLSTGGAERIASDANSHSTEQVQDTPVRVMVPSPSELVGRVPLYGTAFAGEAGDFVMLPWDGGYVAEPPGVSGRRDVFALFVRGDSMEPRFYSGELIYLEKRRVPARNEYVVVELHPDGNGDRAAYLKRLVAITPTKVKLVQHNPERTIEIDRMKIKDIFRVIPLSELVGG